jgi:outer membrane protein assembly factor BamB
MKAPTIITIALGAVSLVFATAAWPRLEASFMGPPTPVKKWEFRTMQPIVQQDCSKLLPFLYWMRTRPCDPRIPDNLPEHSPAIDAEGTIYVGGAKGLYALNPDGTQKWFHENAEQGFNFQAPYRPVLYPFIADDGHIWFDFKAKYETNTAGLSRVDANGEGKAFVSNVSTVVRAGLLKDGSIFVLWDQNGPAFLLPEGYLPETVGKTIDPTVRQEWWDAEFSVPRDCYPAAFGSDGLRYVGCKDSILMMKPTGDAVIWSYATPGYWPGQPAVAEDGTVFFGSEDGHLYALSPNGELKWKFRTGGKVHSTPAIAKNGTIFFGSDDGYLYAVGSDGKAKWRYKTGGAVYSPTIGPDGTVYALSADGMLYAIQDMEPNGGLWGQWPKFAGGMSNAWRAQHSDAEPADPKPSEPEVSDPQAVKVP